MTNEVTLLPCPFCGRSDTTRYGRSSEFHEDCDGDGGNDEYFAVFCDASEPRGLGGCGASGGFAKTCEEAAERWNRRSAVELSTPELPSGTVAREAIAIFESQKFCTDCLNGFDADGKIHHRVGCGAAELQVEPSGDAEDVARWQFVKEQMNYSFDGENRTHYMKAEGRETFEETVDRRRGSSENRTCSDG